MDEIRGILELDDSLSIEQANAIASSWNSYQIHEWLVNVILCDGTPNEAKMAAIVRGIVLHLQKQEERNDG